MYQRLFMMFGMAVVVAGVVIALCRPCAAQSELPSSSLTLTTLLKQQQYVAVPLSRSKTAGYLDVTAQAQGQPLLLYLDTGSTGSQFEDAVVKRLKLSRQRAATGIIAAKQTAPPELVVLKSLSLGGVQLRAEAVVNSLVSANRGRKDQGEPPYDGLLGAQFLKDNAVIIDYGSAQLFLQDRAHPPPPTAATVRTRLLKDAGYIELPLTVRACGHPDVTGELNGQPAMLLVDTGAQSTNLDRAFADELKLPQYDKPSLKMRLLDGSELPMKVTRVNQFALGGITASMEVSLLSLAKLNEWRQGEGYPPWAGLLGAEHLQRLKAVIDYDASKLFLLDPGRKRG